MRKNRDLTSLHAAARPLTVWQTCANVVCSIINPVETRRDVYSASGHVVHATDSKLGVALALHGPGFS